jgi:ParB family chromosome partitioning protein
LLLERLMRSGEGDSALEQGWLLRELHERFGLSATELALRFDKSTSWVSRRLALVRELPESVQELVRRGELAAHAAMKHLVPLARANPEGCVELASALAAQGLSSRQVATLCAAWAAATPESRKLLLAQPLMVIRAEQEAHRPKEMTTGQRLLSDVTALAAIARRARRLVGDGAVRMAPAAELRGALGAAEADTAGLFSVLHKEVDGAGPGRPLGHP